MMERKIGEIFELKGEWYQCLVENDYYRCKDDCVFYNKEYDLCDEESPECIDYKRSDNTNVIFKKLEKVGEPYEYFVQGAGIIMVQEYIIYNQKYIRDAIQNLYIFDCQNGRIAIEVKQNQEDMEEKNNKLIEELDNLFKKHNIYISDSVCESMACEIGTWLAPQNNEEHSNSESIGKDLKPFDLEAAKAGKPVCTRDGRKARIICFDAKRKDEKNIIALVPSKDYPGFEDLISYPNNGNYYGGHENDGDLMMLPEKKEGWVNVYKGLTQPFASVYPRIYKSKEEAINDKPTERRIDTVKISWEE